MKEWRTRDRGSRGQETEGVEEWRTRDRESGGVEDKRQRE